MDDLGLGQKPIIMPHYPHLLAEDSAVWTKYLQDPVGEIKKVWYDVHVGKPVEWGNGGSEMDRRIARGLTRKRIDVVAAVGGGYWVIELKGVGNMMALGQVITYSRLFEMEYAVYGEVWAVVICGVIDEDLLVGYENAGVGLIVV